MREKQTAVRLGNDVMDRINALLEPMSTPVHKATVSDVLRAATTQGLPLLEKQYGAPSPVSMADPMRHRKMSNDEAEAHDNAIEGPCAARKWGPGEKPAQRVKKKPVGRRGKREAVET